MWNYKSLSKFYFSYQIFLFSTRKMFLPENNAEHYPESNVLKVNVIDETKPQKSCRVHNYLNILGDLETLQKIHLHW